MLQAFQMAVLGKQKFIWRKQPSNLIQQPFIQAVLYGSNYKIVKSFILVEEDPGLLLISQTDLFQSEVNSSYGLILRKNALYCVLAVFLNPPSKVFPKRQLFIPLKQKSKMFKKSYLTRRRSRTGTSANSKDGTIYNNILLLKALYY